MPEEESDKITVSALDASRRQIETAISLWFSDGDAVSIHTLVAAAHHVCHDISKARGGKSWALFNMDFINPEHQSEYKKRICEAENFFKHAERNPNPNATVTFSTSITELYILDAIEMFFALNGCRTHLMSAFQFRFLTLNPELALRDSFPMFFQSLSVEWASLSKAQFLDAYTQVREKFWPE